MYVGLFISKSWILSKVAQRVYFCSALLAIAEFGLIIAVKTALVAAGVAELRGGARTLVHILIVPAIVGTAILFVAMLYFWFGFDKSDWLKRACWFLGIYVLPVGTVLYYFLVYRRSPALREVNANEEHRSAAAV